jgi:hypothetical protein
MCKPPVTNEDGSRPQTQPQRLVQPETKHGFRRHVHFFASRDDLRGGTSARNRADGRAFPAAGNRADDGAEHGSAAQKFAGASIRPDALAAILYFLIGRAHAVAPPFDSDGFHVQEDVAIFFHAPGDQPGVRATRNGD